MAIPTTAELLRALLQNPEVGMTDRGLLEDMAKCATFLDAVWGNNTAQNKPELVIWMALALRTARR